jgi:hypothetical protein
MNKTEQETEFEQIQNGGQQKQTPVLNIENNDDSIILSQTKTRGRPRKGSVSSNNNPAANSRANSKERKEAWTCDTCVSPQYFLLLLYSLMFLKGSYCKAMDSPLLH